MLECVFSYLKRWFKSQTWCMVFTKKILVNYSIQEENMKLIISVGGLSQEESAPQWCVCGSTEKNIIW